MIEKIISGGQTGIDTLGLRVGRALGLKTGGTAPKGWKTENGPTPELAEYGLVESWSDDYPPRTEDNVRDADATILLGDGDTPGSVCTLKAIKKHRRPHIVNPTPEEFIAFLIKHPKIKILNVAGNRGSKLTKEDRNKYARLLYETIKQFNESCTT
jgi:hypothetical protein